ncbi:MAG: STAS/SEC14 domain-containing protein [Cyanobacteria bacterium P01_A01_bin.3]
MIETIPTADGRIIGFSIDGAIDEADIKRITDEVMQRLTTHDRLRLYAEVKDWTGITPKALFDDVKFALQHFRDFEREAIVSDKAWLNAMAKAGDRLFPSIEVKHFGWDERAAALTWVEESLDTTTHDGSLDDRATTM